jgi:UDP-galactose transporter B1
MTIESVPLNSSFIQSLESSGSPSKQLIDQRAASARDAYKLCFGAGGIYIAFLYYGSLQEDVFRYKAADGSTFQFAWFLQFLEALANIIVGYIGRRVVGGTEGLPMRQFAITGASQVFSKAFTSLALAKGLSFPVATLAKSGKMAPVMAGQLFLGGASYTIREYLQVLAIIGGTVILSMGKKVCAVILS